MKSSLLHPPSPALHVPPSLRHLTVFYDGHCGLCSSFAEFVVAQPLHFPVEFIPHQDPRALEVFPPLDRFHPDEHLISLSRDGDLFIGAMSWVLCLYATREYRALGKRLASPKLLPLAQKTCKLLARNRRTISRLLFLQKDAEVAEALHQLPARSEGRNSVSTRF